jgi:cytochrome c peroxidase
VSCHIPEKFWSDGRKLGVGIEEGARNTPSVVNARLNRWFGWDGAGDSLWAQSIRPIIDAREMRSDEHDIARLIRTDPDLSCRYRKAFDAPVPSRDEAVLADVGKALAAFQETLVSGRTPFDEFRDALARGDRAAAARYPKSAQRGLRLFVGRGACNLCHFGPNFTNGEFHEIGVPFMTRLGEVDRGRYQGIKAMAANRFNLLRAYNDKPLDAVATSARHVALSMNAYGQFKVPSLRNVAATPPYMHNGSLATLSDVVRHYSEIDPNRIHPAHIYDDALMPEGQPTEAVLKPLKLSAAEIADLVAFLETLSVPVAAIARRPSVKPEPCR